MLASPNEQWLLRLLIAGLWIFISLWAGGTTLLLLISQRKCWWMGGGDKPSPGLRSLRPSLSSSTTSADILRANNSRHLQPTTPNIHLPVVVLKQQALVFSSAAGHFLNKGHGPREMAFRSPLASKFPYLPLNWINLNCPVDPIYEWRPESLIRFMNGDLIPK